MLSLLKMALWHALWVEVPPSPGEAWNRGKVPAAVASAVPSCDVLVMCHPVCRRLVLRGGLVALPAEGGCGCDGLHWCWLL